MSEYDTDGAKITFTYDGQGRRISKGSTNYTYDGSGNLIKQTDGTNTLEFFYDNSGVIGFEHIANNDTKTYIYRRNAQGDIIALLDKEGKVVVKYVYDAWGNVKTYSYDGNELVDHSHIGYINPFRYRGYYYDTETKLYYLKTRYYDPEVGRFITIDDLSYLDPEHINGLNLYAYCLNNPVMCIDNTGTGPISWIEEHIIDPVKHFFTETVPNAVKQAIGWIAVGALTILSVGMIAIGTFLTGGLLACALIGFGAFALVGMGASIYLQGGFANADPWKVFGAGVASGMAGAILGGMVGAMGMGGAYALAQGGAMVMTSVEARVALAGMALGLTILFSSTNRPRDNRKQNEQFREAMRRLGYSKKDWQWRYGHDHLPNESLGFKDLLEFLINLFNPFN